MQRNRGNNKMGKTRDLFKKMRDIKGIFHARMGTIKDRNDSSVQFSRSVMSDSLQPHGLQSARLPCPLPSPRDCSDSCPLSRSCHPTISSSVIPFSSCLQSFPASVYFPTSWLFTSGGQTIGDLASPQSFQ